MFFKTSDESNWTEGLVQFSMVVFCLAILAFRAPLPLLPHGFPPMAISTYSTSSTTPSYSLAKSIKTTRGLRRLTHEPVAVSTRSRRVVPYVNIPLLSQLAANELLVIGLSSIFPGMNGFEALAERAHFGLVNVPLGVIAALPLIIINIYLENSEAPVFYNLNLSTELLVARLFGIFSQPVTALAFSVGLSILTGAAEETLFRGQLLPAFAGFTGSANLAAVTTTFMFAIGHMNLRYPASWRSSENLATLLVHFVSGLYFSALYLWTGDLAPPILAHVVYDSFVLYSTHLKVCTQLEYARKKSRLPGASAAEQAVGSSLNTFDAKDLESQLRFTFYLMDGNRDGLISRKELRIGLYSFGAQLTRGESKELMREIDDDQSGMLDYREFAAAVKERDGAIQRRIKQSLLGVRS